MSEHKDIVERLQRWTALKTGDPAPINNWGEVLTQDINGAIAEIQRLRQQLGHVEQQRDNASEALYRENNRQ